MVFSFSVEFLLMSAGRMLCIHFGQDIFREPIVRLLPGRNTQPGTGPVRPRRLVLRDILGVPLTSRIKLAERLPQSLSLSAFVTGSISCTPVSSR
jgi:hypothetical protein